MESEEFTDMRLGLIRDPELQFVFQVLIIILLLICGGTYLYFNLTLQEINQEYINRNMELVGKILTLHPELEEEIVSLIVKETTSKNLAIGKEVLNTYGYNEELKWQYNTFFKKTYKTLNHSIILVLIVFSMISVVSAYFIINFIYKKLDQFSLSIDQIMNGDYYLRLTMKGEGQLAMLAFHFDQMAERFRLTMRDLKEERQKLKDLISDISHQLKTPLASIRTFNDLLLEESDQATEVSQVFLEKTSQQIDRMEWLIANLLKLSRLESGVVEIDQNPGNLTTLVKGVAQEHLSKIEKKNLLFSLNFPEHSVDYHFDQGWLGEGIGNIIENAIKYTPAGGQIDVSLTDSESRIVLKIQDQGIGISEDELPYIFDRFYRGKSLLAKSVKGTGIGLALTKLIVEKHGGFVRVESKLHEGTTFIVILPKENLTKS